MIDGFDIFAFVVFGVLFATTLTFIVALGSLPGYVATRRAHPQATAIAVASWLTLFTAFTLWPLVLVWAFLRPRPPAEPAAATESRP